MYEIAYRTQSCRQYVLHVDDIRVALQLGENLTRTAEIIAVTVCNSEGGTMFEWDESNGASFYFGSVRQDTNVPEIHVG